MPALYFPDFTLSGLGPLVGHRGVVDTFRNGSAGVSLRSGSSNLDADPDRRTHGSTVARPRIQNVHGALSSTAPVGRNKAFSQKLTRHAAS
ncbi:hypothetical protein GE21DRAFT_1306145 [Neurospora crassa]|nr:hypothetical protein GE21DRAFT_1306145 [Neurospora crassa]